MSSELSPRPDFDMDDFLEKVSGYRYELRKERQVKQKVKAAMSTLGAAVVHLCQVVGEQFKDEDGIQGKAPLLSADLLDDAVLIKSGKRHLTFMTLYGVGSDRELPGGREDRCGHIGAYAHLSDQEKAPLGSRLMIYGNGDISDGKLTWNLSEGIQGFMPYLTKVLGRYIFQMDLYWQRTEDMPAPFSRAHVIEGTLYIDELRRIAVSFTLENPDDLDEEEPLLGQSLGSGSASIGTTSGAVSGAASGVPSPPAPGGSGAAGAGAGSTSGSASTSGATSSASGSASSSGSASTPGSASTTGSGSTSPSGPGATSASSGPGSGSPSGPGSGPSTPGPNPSPGLK